MAWDLCCNNDNVFESKRNSLMIPIRKTLMLIIAISCFTLFYARGNVHAEGSALKNNAYKVGDKLTFEISYFGAVGGTAKLTVVDIQKVNGRDAYHIVSVAKTTKLFSRFYYVRDVIETFIDTKDFYSVGMKIDQHEGKSKKKSEVIFDHKNSKAIIIKENNRKVVYDIVNGVQDSLSSLFYVRLNDLEVGKDLVFDTYASRKNWQLVVKVLKKERIKVKAGTFNTIKVKPLLKYNDVFINKGDVFIWLTDDERKIPVKMKSKIVIGSITSELIGM